MAAALQQKKGILLQSSQSAQVYQALGGEDPPSSSSGDIPTIAYNGEASGGGKKRIG
jgi:hypothetical protein